MSYSPAFASILVLCLAATGCKDFAAAYDREYVLYDGAEARERESIEQARLELERERLELEQDRLALGGATAPATVAVPVATAASAASTTPAEPVTDEDFAVVLARTFALETEIDELDRWIRDGRDSSGALAARRAEAEEELVAGKRSVGLERYLAAVRERREAGESR